MYSASRGILYTAPPDADGTNENRSADTATDADDAVAAASSESAGSLEADD